LDKVRTCAWSRQSAEVFVGGVVVGGALRAAVVGELATKSLNAAPPLARNVSPFVSQLRDDLRDFVTTTIVNFSATPPQRRPPTTPQRHNATTNCSTPHNAAQCNAAKRSAAKRSKAQ